MAKATASRSSGLAGILRRSWRRRRPGYVADAPDDSLRESNRDHVKEMREGEIKREGERRIPRRAGGRGRRGGEVVGVGASSFSRNPSPEWMEAAAKRGR